jgi:hypothetical protein
MTLINNTTEAQWNDNNSAPLSGTPGFPPNAYTNFPDVIAITLNYQNQFWGGII